jgi:hypothetical protein
LLLAGRCEAGLTALQTFCALKFTQLGALDASFGAAGVATTWPGGMGSRLANVMAVTATDQILLAGDCNDYHGGQLNCVAALSPAGARDLTYGNVVGDGFTFIDLGSAPNITALSVMSDGRLLVGNRCNQGLSSAYCVMRLDATGQIDNDFGTFAKITAQMNNGVVSSGGLSLVAETTEGTVLLLGGCAYNQVTPGNSRFCATRFWDSARTYVGCSLDIDGDGKLLGTTDGLLLSRALAGMSGPALVANAVNAAGSRLSYQAVEQFISQRCGLRLQAPFVNHSTSACHFDLNPVPDHRVNQADLLTILRGLFNQKGATAIAVPGTAAQATARLQACGWTGSF